MFRYQVEGLEAVERYVVNWVEQFGASLDPPGEIELIRVAFPGGEQLRVAPFTLRFPTRTALTVRLTAEQVGGTSVEVVTYAFHFRTPDGYWRYCRNRHHLAEDGTEFHVHLATGRRLPRLAPVTFDQIFELVTLDNAQREAR